MRAMTVSTLAPAATAPPAPARLSAWYQSVTSTSLEAHARVQDPWALDYVQLSQGRFHGHIENIHMPGLTLVHETLSVATRQRGRLNDSAYGFAVRDPSSADFFSNGRRMPANAIMCGKGDEIDITTPERSGFIGMAVQRDLLEPLWQSMYRKPLATWLDQHLVLETTSVKAAALWTHHRAAMGQARDLIDRQASAGALLQLRDEVLAQWLETLPAQVDLSDLPTLKRRKQVVDKACERMMAQVDAPESLLSVCSRLGVSVRKLNYCFQDVLGISPNKYHKLMRLNGLHRALTQAQAGDNVQDLAALWGFWHLSQLARDYKRQFQVLPSTTLKQAQSSARPGASLRRSRRESAPGCG